MGQMLNLRPSLDRHISSRVYLSHTSPLTPTPMSTALHFDEFVAKYGDTPVQLDSYYKFTFTFVGLLPDGRKLYARVGGSADDIYRLGVDAGKVRSLRDLHDSHGVASASVYDGGTKVEYA